MNLEIESGFTASFGFYPISSLPQNHDTYVDQGKAEFINRANALCAIPGVNVVTGLFLAVVSARLVFTEMKLEFLAGVGIYILRAVLGPVFLFIDIPLYIHRCNQAKNNT